MNVQFLDANGEPAGGFDIFPKEAPQFALDKCVGYSDFDGISSFNVAAAVLNVVGISVVWTITKTLGQDENPKIEMKLNDKVILDFTVSEATCSDHGNFDEFWSRKVKRIKFWNWDKASNYYKRPPEKCERLPTGWTHMETETQFPVDKGTTLTVSCTESYELVGDSEITCNGNNDEFSYETTQPRCGE